MDINNKTNKGGLVKRFASKAKKLPYNSPAGVEVYKDPNWENPKKENPVKKVATKLADRFIQGSTLLSGKKKY